MDTSRHTRDGGDGGGQGTDNRPSTGAGVRPREGAVLCNIWGGGNTIR